MIITVPLLICLAIVAWLTGAATAVRSVSRIWLRHWAELQLRGAPSAELYLERPQRLLLAAATAVAATVYVAGTIIGALPSDRPLLALEALVLFSILVLVFGQLIPRAVARRWATGLVPVLLPPLRAVEIALTPLLALVHLITRPLARRANAGVPQEPHDELEDLLREGQLEGVGEATEIAIISGVMQFGQKTLGEVMTPRADVFAVDEGTLPRERALAVARSGYSRVPVYRGSIDQIVGMVHVFDVLKAPGDDVLPLRPVAYAPRTGRCNEFLFTMLRGRLHLAVIQEADGRTAGIVTLEDLLEELVGDIRDEHDDPVATTNVQPPQPS
jgi:putative hemolysin